MARWRRRSEKTPEASGSKPNISTLTGSILAAPAAWRTLRRWPSSVRLAGGRGLELEAMTRPGAHESRTLLPRDQAGEFLRPLPPGALWSGCPDLNRGPLRPERSALTKLRYSPCLVPGVAVGSERSDVTRRWCDRSPPRRRGGPRRSGGRPASVAGPP